MTVRTSWGVRLRDHGWALLAILLVAAAAQADEDSGLGLSRPTQGPAPATAPPSDGTQAAALPPAPEHASGGVNGLQGDAALGFSALSRGSDPALPPLPPAQDAGPTNPVPNGTGRAEPPERFGTEEFSNLSPETIQALRRLRSALHDQAGNDAAPEPSRPATMAEVRPTPYLPEAPKFDPAMRQPGARELLDTVLPFPAPSFDSDVQQAGCATCGGQSSLATGPVFVGSGGCAGGACIPGRPPCYSLPEPCTFVGYLINNLYECLCCPDPCYQPKWVPEANASFFVDYARTRTVTRLRFDRGLDLQFPDRNEYFYKQVILGKFGSGSNPPRPFRVNGVRFRADPSLNFNQLYFYQEVAAGKASFFVEVPPYRQISPLFGQSHAGFSDMNLGTKAMIFDCEMLQLTMQFRTFLPTGNAMEGLGTGHVSLEPSLLGALRLAEQTYFQGQLAQWIPLGGTSGIAGGILHYHFSLNQTLCRVTPDSPLIGTFEMNGWSFQNGGFTNPVAAPNQPQRLGASGQTYFSLGPGLRQSVCNGIDFGGAIVWPVTDHHWADPLFRVELRILY